MKPVTDWWKKRSVWFKAAIVSNLFLFGGSGFVFWLTAIHPLTSAASAQPATTQPAVEVDEP